jgi:hypothetical protein
MDQSFSSISEAGYVGVSVSTIQSRLASKNTLIGLMLKLTKVATRVARPVVIDQTDYISGRVQLGKIFVQNQIGAILIPWI